MIISFISMLFGYDTNLSSCAELLIVADNIDIQSMQGIIILQMHLCGLHGQEKLYNWEHKFSTESK